MSEHEVIHFYCMSFLVQDGKLALLMTLFETMIELGIFYQSTFKNIRRYK